jgi:RNA polymerase sigma factor (sigma-70 family)
LIDADVERLLRDTAPHVLGILVRRYRDFAAAEDALQEALLAAVSRWPQEGVPDDPRAWLIHAASRRMIDHIRSNVARRRRENDVAMQTGYFLPPGDVSQDRFEDDTLSLMYMCCHPSLSTSSAIALTLRAVGGLTTAEIARAFLVPEATMAQRISRAKQTIQSSGVPFQSASRKDEKQALQSLLHVLYLIFNEGYTASTGEELQRTNLASEAIRLARIVHAQLPAEAEVTGLLALMLLTDARRTARSGPDGEIIPLEQQNRQVWDRNEIAEGVALIGEAFRRGAVGPYQLQAAIAALHDEAASTKKTDWPQIAVLYELLIRITGNPMARLNHAVAVAMSQGVARGLELIEELHASDKHLREHYRLYAVWGHLREMSGDLDGAIEAYRTAATGTASLPERNYLFARAATLSET